MKCSCLIRASAVDTRDRSVRYLAMRAQEINCSVAIYSHGGWMGEPENELKVVSKVGMPNVGIVYDYEHGRPQMDRFAVFFPKLVPQLWAVILNGIQAGGPDFITVGDGDRDLGMLKVIRDRGYSGPIGIMEVQDRRNYSLITKNDSGNSGIETSCSAAQPQA